MEVALVIGVLAAVAGILRGGSLRSIAETQFRYPWLIFAGFAAQIAVGFWEPGWLSDGGALAVLLVSNGLIATFVVLNRTVAGMLLVGLGLALNVAVISANGAMPVSRSAAERSGATTDVGDEGVEHEVLNEETLLPWLGDVIPVPGLGLVLSVGDLLLAGGIARLVYCRSRSGTVDVAPSKTASG